MKGINIFCPSQPAICRSTTMEEHSSSSSSACSCNDYIILPSSSPAIDRYNPIITDSSRIPKKPPPPSHIIIPKPPQRSSSHHHKKKKNKNRRIPFKDENQDHQSKKSHEISAPDIDDTTDIINTKDDASTVANKGWRPTNISCPPGSTRYLLEEDTSLDFVVEEPHIAKDVKTNQEMISWDPRPHQVMVLRVSLHCRGCEKKLRKHLSEMEGLTSFNIEFAAKNVTVSGSVTPLEVLETIPKVKNAQLWPSTAISPLSPNPSPINFRNSQVYVGDQSVSVS